MKYLTLFVAALVAFAVVGCGGSSGNGDSNTPGDNFSTPRIEAVVRVERTNLRNQSQFTDEELQDPQIVTPADLIEPTVYGVQDLFNFQASESYYFQLVSYSDDGRRIILPAAFDTDDTTFTHGVVGNSGLYLASNVPTNEPKAVSAVWNGQRYSALYQLRERQVRVLGRVVTDNESAMPLRDITIDFFDANGLPTGTVKSGYDGSFRASLPLRTASFTVNSQLLPTRFFQSFVFGGSRYNAGDPGCRAPVSFTELGTVNMSDVRVTERVEGQTTPTADGCGGGNGN